MSDQWEFTFDPEALDDLESYLDMSASERITQLDPPPESPPPSNEPQEAEIISSWHVQVRLDQPGPPKADGRRGMIVLEDADAPREIVNWLLSPRCAKSQIKHRSTLVYVNDELVTHASLLAPDADDPSRQLTPSMMESAAVAAASAYQDRLGILAAQMERELESTRERCRREAEEARKARDREIASCDRAIEESRKRLQRELEREDKELEALQARRAVLSASRTDLALDVERDRELVSELKEKMLEGQKSEDTLVDKIVGVAAALDDERVQRGLGALIMMVRGKPAE